MTREKGLGDHKDIIDPHFGKNAEGINIVKLQGPAGPSEIFNSNVIRELDVAQNIGFEETDPITVKAFKHKNVFDPQAISTCPLISKHHRTFG